MRQTAETPRPTVGVDKRVVLLVASMASFLSSIMGSAVNVALPTIGREFSMDAVALAWIATAYLIAVAISMVPAGRIADIHGRKRLFLIGVVGWTLSSFLCGLSSSGPMLIIFRTLQGIAGAMFFGTSTAIVTSVYPPQERGHALGINVAAVYGGLALGPSVGGILTQQIGWRSMFFLNSVLGAVIVGLILWKMNAEWAEARGEKLDIVGSAIFAVALTAVMYGFSVLPSALGSALIVLGIGCLVAFVVWESRVSHPVMNIALFRTNYVFAMSNLAALTNYAATSAITFLLSLYLQFVKGLDPQTAGLVLLAQPVMMVIFSPLAGRLSDRVEPRILASAGMSLTTMGLVMFAFLDDSSGVEYVVLALLVAGVGFGLFSSPNTNAVMSSVERRYLGVASAILGTMRTVGMTLSVGIATLIIALFVGGVQITPEHHASFTAAFRLAFVIFSLVCAFGVFASFARGNVRAGGDPRIS